MNLGLPYTQLIESLENEVARGNFTAWSCAHSTGALSAFYADEAAPREWLLDQNTELHPHQHQNQYWMPSYDLASLSKPLLANAWLRHCLGSDAVFWCLSPLDSLIEPRSQEGELLKKWCQAHSHLTLLDLVNHTSGLPAWRWFGRALWKFQQDNISKNRRATSRLADLQNDSSGEESQKARLELTSHILSLPVPEKTADRQTNYSDLNYYLLARVIENLCTQAFSGWEGILSELNGLWGTQFWHASLDPERSLQAIPYHPYLHSQIVAHIYENRNLNNHAGEFGSVHDTNANILATEFRTSSKTNPIVSSHSGMFGNVLDVCKTVPFFIATQNELNAMNVNQNKLHSRFSWGMDTPSSEQSAAGLTHWPTARAKMIFGHLGYTGTSLWMADDGQFHILLTNRTARRRIVGSTRVSRVLIFQKDFGNEPLCWIQKPTQTENQNGTKQWQTIGWQDVYTLCYEHSRMTTRYWDRLALRTPPDLAAVRRGTGRLLWSH